MATSVSFDAADDKAALLRRLERAEAALRESEERHRLLIGSWAQAMWETDAAGTVVADSPSWRAYTGQTQEELLGYGWLDAIHPDDRGYAERQWRDATAARSVVNAEFRLRAPDGGWRWTNVRAVPMLDAGGAIAKWAGINIDINLRKGAEAALRESEERYRTLFQTMGQGYLLVEIVRDGDGKVVDCRYLELNPAFERLTGLSLKESVGKTATELFGGVEKGWFEALNRVVQSGVPESIEQESAAVGRWFEAHYYRQSDERISGFFEDITERKRAEAALRESEARLGFLLDLTDALRPLTDAGEIERQATRLLGEHREADRCFLSLVNDGGTGMRTREGYLRSGASSVLGEHSFAEFGHFVGPSLHAGQIVAVEDVDSVEGLSPDERASYAALEVGAYLLVPLISEGRLAAILSISHRAPRAWSDADRAVARQTADRLWTAREGARAEAALRESELRFREFGENSADALWIVDAETKRLEYLSAAFETIWGERRDAVMNDIARWTKLIHPADRAAAAEALPRAIEGKSLVAEYRIVRPDGEARWIRDAGFPIAESGVVKRVGGIAQDVTELRATELRLQALLDGIPQLVWRASDPGSWTWASPQWTAYTGRPQADSHGWGWLETLHPDDREAARQAWSHAVERGEFDVEHRIRIDHTDSYRWFQSRAVPIRGVEGVITEWVGTSTDIDELRRLQDLQKTLLAELQHRVRNVLAVIRSMMRRSSEGQVSLSDYLQHFEGRLSALARTQVLLTRAVDAQVNLEDLIREELVAQAADEDNVTIEGPEVEIGAKAAEVVSLAIHELTTNAVKYGALSREAATLRIGWDIEERADVPWLRLIWSELGVPVSRDPLRREGFGSELITRRIPYELKGTGSLEMRSGGIQCRLEFPLRDRPSIFQTDTRHDGNGAT